MIDAMFGLITVVDFDAMAVEEKNKVYGQVRSVYLGVLNKHRVSRYCTATYSVFFWKEIS